MKFNWGHGIAAFIGFFFIAIFSFIFFTLQFETNLVEEDYYPKEIAYQEKIDKMHNTELLKEKIRQSKD